MRHAVILAGGSGTRLWPASRSALPKQLLPLASDDELLIEGAVAIGRRVADDRVSVVTAEAQTAATRAAVQSVDLIIEPMGRNTAAAIGLAGMTIAERDPDAVIAFMPADHHVRHPLGMAEALNDCFASVEKDDTIALVGIPPNRPETGFGYLKIGTWGKHEFPFPVERFVEKPDRATAESYFTNGGYLWNAGIFCMTARRLVTELEKHLPATARILRQIVNDDSLVDPRDLYAKLESISFDHGVMEKTDRVVVVPAEVGWNDVGSWSALPEVRGTDTSSNTIVGTAVVIDGGGNVVVADDGALVATVGVSDLVIIKSGDAVLVVRKTEAQRVREIVEALGVRGLSRFL